MSNVGDYSCREMYNLSTFGLKGCQWFIKLRPITKRAPVVVKHTISRENTLETLKISSKIKANDHLKHYFEKKAFEKNKTWRTSVNRKTEVTNARKLKNTSLAKRKRRNFCCMT